MKTLWKIAKGVTFGTGTLVLVSFAFGIATEVMEGGLKGSAERYFGGMIKAVAEAINNLDNPS